MKDYHINIFFSEEDGGYIADIPDLAHCAAFCETPEQALSEVLKELPSGDSQRRDKRGHCSRGGNRQTRCEALGHDES